MPGFAEWVLSRVPEKLASFPLVSYDPDGDSIEVLLTNESYYAQWRGDVTVYRSQETDEVVGVLIEGARALTADQR